MGPVPRAICRRIAPRSSKRSCNAAISIRVAVSVSPRLSEATPYAQASRFVIWPKRPSHKLTTSRSRSSRPRASNTAWASRPSLICARIKRSAIALASSTSPRAANRCASRPLVLTWPGTIARVARARAIAASSSPAVASIEASTAWAITSCEPAAIAFSSRARPAARLSALASSIASSISRASVSVGRRTSPSLQQNLSFFPEPQGQGP